MPLIHLNADCFITLAGFVFSLKDLVRLWIALGCKLPANGKLWTYALMEYLGDRTLEGSNNLEDITIRLGCRLDSRGLLLIERMFINRKCSRSGCFQFFQEINNHSKACCYHPGALRRGKLTCCRQSSFRDKGCTLQFHSGALHEAMFSKREEEVDDSENQEYAEIRSDRHKYSISDGK